MTTDPRRESFIAAARDWQRADPDPRTRAEVDHLLQDATTDELAELFGKRLSFGTAGLRGPLGPGPNRMNSLTCRQAAAGLASVLADTVENAAGRGVVVAHDARHGSDRFSTDITEVLSARGLDVHRIDGPAPTPLAAFAVRHLGAAAGVVVTASHNPPTDNGLKVYWSDGAQIVEPIDDLVADRIEQVARTGTDPPRSTMAGEVHHLGTVEAGTPLVEAYLRAAGELRPGPPHPPRRLAVTSLHGVGADLLELTLQRHGHTDLHQVADQRRPDPDFPTVAFPNPEEPGAMDAVIALATRLGAALALANDPDADRLAIAAPGPDGGRWRILTGDEVGALLTAHLLDATSGTRDRLVATTVVSSRLLSSMAEHAGVHFAETLTGFKWLCRPALENPSWHQVIAYEEALGYAVGPDTRDKDGITAALVAADMACSLHASGRSVWDVLDDLARSHGAHVTANGSLRLSGPDATRRVGAITARLRAEPPSRLGGIEVERTDTPGPGVLRLWCAEGTRVVLRPSGTEAKFKYYCEAIEPVAPEEHPDESRARARNRLAGISADLISVIG